MDNENTASVDRHLPKSGTHAFVDAARDSEARSTVLFVCSANVCRSPLMEMTFRNAAGDRFAHAVLSRGVAVAGGDLCATAASMVPLALAQRHVAVEVDRGALESAAIVLTATIEQRSLLARMIPAMRSRTFTLTEALLLGAEPLDGSEVERAHRSSEAESTSVGGYAGVLNGRRGRVLIPPPARRGLLTSKVPAEDTPDVHGLSARRHEEGLKRVRRATRMLHQQLAAAIAVLEH